VITDSAKVGFFDEMFLSGMLDEMVARDLMCQYMLTPEDEPNIREALLVVIEYYSASSDFKQFKENYVESTTD
tara:strand:- start:526 stop:744 length:219 start_codon:yes stop_codon:yes gene_type:complete